MNREGRPAAELQRPQMQPVVRAASPDDRSPAPLPLTPPSHPDGWSPVPNGASRPPARLMPPEPERPWVPPAAQAVQGLK